MNDMFNADNALQVIACIVVCYLIGSFPTAYFVGKARNVNIFEVGSGNMGGTNVARAVGKGWAVFTGLVDVSKGVFAVWLARDVILPEQIGVATSISATSVVVGHNWSLFATILTASIKEGKLRFDRAWRQGRGDRIRRHDDDSALSKSRCRGHRHRHHLPHALCLLGRLDRIRCRESLANPPGRDRFPEADPALICGCAQRYVAAAAPQQCSALADGYGTAPGRAGLELNFAQS